MANWVATFLQNHPELSDKIVKKARNAIHTLNDNGTITARCLGKPIYYQDELDEWQPLDTAIMDMGNGEYGANGIPVRLTQAGLVKILGTANEELYSQVTTRVLWYNSATDNYGLVINFPTGTIQDDKLIKQTDIYTHTLTLTENGLREELVLSEMPSGITDNENLWLVLDTVVTGVTFDDGWFDEFEVGQMLFPLPHGEDADGRKANVKRYAKNISGVQHILTGIKFSELYRATYPVKFDPDFSAGTDDYYTLGYDASSYSSARNTGDSVYQSATFLSIGQSEVAGEYSIWRAFLLFDTSSIPDDATINQVNLYMTVESISILSQPGDDFDVQIVKQNWTYPTNPPDTDWDACLNGTADNNIWQNTGDISDETEYASGNLDTSWVSKTGTTYYSLRSSSDKNNSAPDAAEYIDVHSQNSATSSKRPVLTIDYTTTSIATINGLAIASVATFNGLTMSSVNDVNGLE